MQPELPPEGIFKHNLQQMISSLTQLETDILAEVFKPCSDNERQKLKAIKRILDSQQDSPAKSNQHIMIELLKEKLGTVIIREYVFGNLETKPFIMNILKNTEVRA